MDEKIFLVRVAEQAERFDDMFGFLKEVISLKDSDFTTEERNLLSVGFKNLIGANRTAIRTIAAIEQNPKYTKFNGALEGYKKKIEGELDMFVDDLMGVCASDVLANDMKVAKDIVETLLGSKAISVKKTVSGRLMDWIGWEDFD